MTYFYIDYPEHCYYWDYAHMAQRITLVLVFVYFTEYNHIRGILAFLTLAAFYSASFKLSPYENIAIKRFDLASGVLQLLTILLAILI